MRVLADGGSADVSTERQSGPSRLIVCVYDSAVRSFMHPLSCSTKGEAIRNFQDAVSDERSPFHRHPEHFALFVLGTFDEGLGSFENRPAPELLVLASSLVKEG